MTTYILPIKFAIYGLIFLSLSTHATFAHERLGTIEFKSATIGDAARVIGELSKVNIVVTEAAKNKTVSLHLKNASVESTIDGLCRVTGLWYRKSQEFNAYYIMTEDEFKKDIVVERDFVTKIFELKHQNISDAANAIAALFGERVTLSEPKTNASYELEGDFGGGSGGSSSSTSSDSSSSGGSGSNGSSDTEIETRRSFFSKADLSNTNGVFVAETELVKTNIRGEPSIYVTWNHLHNLLLIRTSDKQALHEIEALIKRIDKPAQQVLLEMKILRATLGDEERSIFDYSYQRGKIDAGVDEDGNQLNTPKIDLSLGNFPLEGGAFLAKLAGSKLNATIELLRTENRVHLLAQPNIISANNKEAKLTIGEDRVLVKGASTDVITNDTSTIVAIEFNTSTQNIGTTLSIWPRINGDKTVTLDIEQSNTSLNKNSGTLPISNGLGDILNINIDSVIESAIELTAIARHGATIAIGGMIETDVQDFHEKVPVLGDIPVLGKLFRKDYSKNVRSELIILITPWVSENPENIHILNKKRTSNWTNNPEFSSHLSAPEDNDTPAHWPLNVRKNAIAMIRNAVANERAGSKPLASCTTAEQHSASRFTDWKIDDSLLISAQHHCQTDGLFLSQAIISNTSDREKHLRPDLFNQGWVASHGESTLLPPNTSQIVFFVSATAPEILLRQQQETFFYGEGALDVQ